MQGQVVTIRIKIVFIKGGDIDGITETFLNFLPLIGSSSCRYRSKEQ